jgi:hypothetical protein
MRESSPSPDQLDRRRRRILRGHGLRGKVHGVRGRESVRDHVRPDGRRGVPPNELQVRDRVSGRDGIGAVEENPRLAEPDPCDSR